MATSGTVGSTVIDVTTVIEHAVRRCGVSVASLPAESLVSTQENLYLLLTNLANRGINLWCVQKQVLALIPNQKVYNMPVGTVDLLRANYRQVQQPSSTPVLGAGIVGLDYGAGNSYAVMTVGITLASSGPYSFVVESSTDNATWTTRLTLPAAQAFVAGAQQWFDVDNSALAEFWRVREIAAQSLAGAAVIFGSTPTEIPMAKLSRDDYTTLPNKDFTTNRPLQLWYDKQASQPRVWLWPVPNDATVQVVTWVHRNVQDVGALTNTLEIPARWQEAIITMLAYSAALEIPGVDPQRRAELKVLKDEYLKEAEDDETDGAPIRFAPNIKPYTA